MSASLTTNFRLLPPEGGGGMEEKALKCRQNHGLAALLAHRHGVACEREETGSVNVAPPCGYQCSISRKQSQNVKLYVYNTMTVPGAIDGFPQLLQTILSVKTKTKEKIPYVLTH